MNDHDHASRLIEKMTRNPNGSLNYEVLNGMYPHGEEYEQHLVGELAAAQRTLDAYRTGQSLARCLDALLPGWVDLDISDFKTGSILARDWHTFVSNDEGTWVEWLMSKGVDREEAAAHVRASFAEHAAYRAADRS